MNELLEYLLGCIVEIVKEKANNKDGLQIVKIEQDRIVVAIHRKKKVNLFEIREKKDVEQVSKYFD